MSEWKKTYLRDLIVIKNGKDHKKLKNGQYPVYGSGGIMRYADSYLYDQESVLLPRKGTLNNIQFVTEPFWTVDTCYYTVVNRDKVLPYFLYCCLCKMDIQSLNTGSAVPSMTFEKYYSIELPIPPLSTQHRIASILSRYDSLIENYQKQIKLLEEAAQRLYKEWFIDLRFPGHENTKIVDGLPEGWEKKKISDVCETVGGGTPSTKVPAYYKGGRIKWVTPTDITRNNCICLLDTDKKITEEGLRNSSTKMVPAGTILMTSRASVGYFGIADFEVCTNQGFISCIPIPNMQMYLLFNLMSRVDEIRKKAGGSTYLEISKSVFRNFDIVCPSEIILLQFQDKASLVLKKEKTLSLQLRLLTEARDRFLPKLMSGEITV